MTRLILLLILLPYPPALYLSLEVAADLDLQARIDKVSADIREMEAFFAENRQEADRIYNEIIYKMTGCDYEGRYLAERKAKQEEEDEAKDD